MVSSTPNQGGQAYSIPVTVTTRDHYLTLRITEMASSRVSRAEAYWPLEQIVRENGSYPNVELYRHRGVNHSVTFLRVLENSMPRLTKLTLDLWAPSRPPLVMKMYDSCMTETDNALTAIARMRHLRHLRISDNSTSSQISGGSSSLRAYVDALQSVFGRITSTNNLQRFDWMLTSSWEVTASRRTRQVKSVRVEISCQTSFNLDGTPGITTSCSPPCVAKLLEHEREGLISESSPHTNSVGSWARLMYCWGLTAILPDSLRRRR